ncbi:hypothetical protein KR074_003216, partial [Drosophila pseudoananassae]
NSKSLNSFFFFVTFQVVISGALCTVEDYVIMSLCAQDKAIHLAAEGTVSVTDTSQIQNITILGFPDYLNQEFTFKLALYAKETQRYLCFNDNWRLVGMTKLRDTCYFNETIHHGYFVFRSIVDSERRVGFTHGGKPVGPKMSVKDACYHFNKIDVETFYRQHRHLNSNGNSGNSNSNSNGSSNSNSKNRKPPRNNKNNRHKSNNQNQKLQQQQEHHGHNNNNVILNNNSSNSLSRTNKKQQSKQQQQQQQQHQVRHHHNDPSLLARRQQHERKQKRRKQQKQQQHQQQQQQRVTASPTKPATATTPVATSPATATTAATLSSKRKGRRRKGKSRQQKLQRQQQQQLAPAATATTAYTDDSFYSSSIGSSTGFEDLDPYNVSSSSSTSLDPWSTWSTIDSFSSSSNSGSSSSSTTTTSDDSISSSSNYDLWATMITKMEAEASETTSELSGNDTDLLLHYEPQIVEDTGVQEEAESTATYETKATSAIAAIAATAATTTSTTGQQLVIEQTPLQQEMARRISTPAATATATTTSAATTTPTASTSQTETTRSTQNQGQNEVKPPQRQHKFLVSRQPSATTRVHHLSSTAETLATTPQQEQKQPSSLFSIYKNINSDLNNSLTEASPTATATTRATSTVTAATTTKKSLRKFTRKLMATPYHQLTYVRNEAGDIDIDNLDNISVYPDLYEGELESNGNGSSNSTDINRQMPVSLSSYLPTTTTSVLTEFIRIGKNKIDRALKRSQMQKHRRFA